MQKRATFLLMFILIVAWLFSGWPQIWHEPSIPPEVQKVYAGSQTFTSTGTFNVPAGVTSVTVKTRGGGSGGGEGQSNKPDRSGGGGGGGAYTECTSAVTAETGYTVTVGAAVGSATAGNASSFPGNDGTCNANGGNLGTNTSGGSGGAVETVGGIVDASFAGGAGGNGSNVSGSGGGGGGEGADTVATGGAGSNNSGSTGGTGGTGGDGGDGGAGGNDTSAGSAGTAPGGGGGGAGAQNNTGGGGARGEVLIEWTDPSNSAPTISNLILNDGPVTLTEGTFKWATSTMTVTDADGCSEITSVTADFFLASTSNSGTICSYDGNNCYASSICIATTTGDTCSADTTVEYDCGFQVWYIAEPTDLGQWASSIWSVGATTSDGTDTGTATNTSQTIEVNTLNALDVTTSFSYGSVNPNTDTGTENQFATTTNTGNTRIDADISGVKMCTDYPTCSGDAADFIAESQQKFDTSNVTYASLANTLAASTSPATIELDLLKPTATTSGSEVTDVTYWGIKVPLGRIVSTFTGLITFSAVPD